MSEALASTPNEPLIGPTETHIVRQLRRWTAVGRLALVAATWRRWTPQAVFPQIPAFEILCNAPAWIDWICLACLLTGLALLALGTPGRIETYGSLLVLVSLSVFFCLDQHRFQPWAYQLWLLNVIWTCCGSRLCFHWMSWLTVSVYFYSALGKLDFEFLHSVGLQMLGVLFRIAGQDVSLVPPSMQIAMVTAFPCIELIIAICLATRKLRRVAGLSAIGLHLTLIVVLGPLGLGHRFGVLIWNALFAVQAYYLFVMPRTARHDNAHSEHCNAPNLSKWTKSSADMVCSTLIAVVMAMPATERFGLWDHWPSWALYAPHSSRVHVEVAAGSISRLPRELAALIQRPNGELDASLDWAKVPIDAWSLQTLDAPIYPQARFQLGVARHVTKQVDAEFQVRVTILGTANRITGLRQSKTIDTSVQIAEASMGDFWFNSKPRESP